MNFHPANLEALMSIFSKKSIISFIFKDSFVKKYLLPSSGHGRAAKALGHMGACLRLRGTRKISYLLSEKSSLNFTELAAVIKIAFSCLFFSIQFDYEIRQKKKCFLRERNRGKTSSGLEYPIKSRIFLGL